MSGWRFIGLIASNAIAELGNRFRKTSWWDIRPADAPLLLPSRPKDAVTNVPPPVNRTDVQGESSGPSASSSTHPTNLSVPIDDARKVLRAEDSFGDWRLNFPSGEMLNPLHVCPRVAIEFLKCLRHIMRKCHELNCMLVAMTANEFTTESSDGGEFEPSRLPPGTSAEDDLRAAAIMKKIDGPCRMIIAVETRWK